MTGLADLRDAVVRLPLRRARRPERVRLFGLLAVKDAMRYLPGWFATNAAHLDGVLVYDDGSVDGSAEFAAAQPSVLEVVRRDPTAPPGWDESRTRRALHLAAAGHDSDWLVAVDADERLEEQFGARARREIVRLERRGIDAAAIRVPELWGAADQVRTDGIWAERWRARLFRWRADARIDDRRLHGHWAPLDSAVRGGFVPVDLAAYHLHMIDPADRRARADRYERLDPQHTAQPAGYDYLVDEQGIQVEPLPPGRAYAPLHRDPDLAVVVLAVGCPASLPDAVASLLAQRPRPEVCVISSGGHGARAAVAPMGVQVVEVEHLLLPGAARNAGIARTRAPVVAFLAADCRAEPGWVAARLSAHRAGALAVASAVTNSAPDSAPARIGHIQSFGRRLPGVPAARAARYGVSYDRALLAATGAFREDLATGEDTELHRRLGVPIAWVPSVRTVHLSPTTATALWHDQRRRGANAARAWAHLDGRSRLRTAAAQLRGLPADLVVAWQATPSGERGALVRATPWLALGCAARLAGSLSLSGPVRRGAGPEDGH